MRRRLSMRALAGAAATTAALLAAAAPAEAAPTRFTVVADHADKVTFTSKAPLETFQGKTDRVAGEIVADPADLGDSATVRIEVDLASLDTGIDKRNQHMREKHLETAKYPKAIFTGAAILGPKPAKLAPGKSVPLEVEGTFSLHGVDRRLRTTVEVTLLDGGGPPRLKLHARFPVSLSDYAISRPEFLFLKLSDAQDVEVTAVAAAESDTSAERDTR